MSVNRAQMRIIAAISYGEGDEKITWWTHIGFAEQNEDESWDLHLDLRPVSHFANISLRPSQSN